MCGGARFSVSFSVYSEEWLSAGCLSCFLLCDFWCCQGVQ